jgi:hypothetical protein
MEFMQKIGIMICITVFFINTLFANESLSKVEKTKKYNLAICAIFKNEAPY